MSNIDRSDYYNIKFQKKPLMIWIWISVVMLSVGGLLSLFRNANTIKSLIIFLFIFIIGVFFLSLNRNVNYDTKYIIGNKLAEIKLENFNSNKTFIVNNLKKDDFILINFWASWCAPCRVEHPYLMQLTKSQNIKILGVNFKDKKINALKFLENFGDPYDYLAKDELGKSSVNYGIYGIPESILLNSELVILKKFIGPLNKKN